MTGPVTLLLVEDDPALLRTLALALGARGYKVLTAGCVRDGLSLVAETRHIDAMVVDLGLPDGPGWELVEHLRRSGCTPPPTVLISASTLSRKEVQAHGLAAYLPKPFSVEHLVEVVSLALQRPRKALPPHNTEVIL